MLNRAWPGGRLYKIGASALALALLATAPLYFSRLSLLFFILNWIVLAESFNIFTGLTGYVNFGHVVFYGMGGYVGALLMAGALASPYVGVLAAGLASALLALGLSLPTLRLRGAYFAIASLGVNEATFVIFDNWPAVGSATGITLPVVYYQPLAQYYTMLAVAAGCLATAYVLMHSRIGTAMQAIRQQEDTARSVGINATYYKTLALIFSGLFAGMAGALAIWQVSIIDPPSAFDITISLNAISMTMLGGIGTLAGPVLGAVVLYEVGDFLDLNYPYAHLVVLGVIIIGVVLAMPRGMMGYADRVRLLLGGGGRKDGGGA
ncbi:MAG: branched-chain amino acid ABC transporter permease [Nitrososphaerota archaeon]|nr:branched-chain amino acid ABC transporter permease [Nitrososphaerota archaeon]MDG6938941.1 branched-chain amino acid ABC transporter permease [Nitrososphaerota archaeon]